MQGRPRLSSSTRSRGVPPRAEAERRCERSARRGRLAPPLHLRLVPLQEMSAVGQSPIRQRRSPLSPLARRTALSPARPWLRQASSGRTSFEAAARPACDDRTRALIARARRYVELCLAEAAPGAPLAVRPVAFDAVFVAAWVVGGAGGRAAVLFYPFEPGVRRLVGLVWRPAGPFAFDPAEDRLHLVPPMPEGTRPPSPHPELRRRALLYHVEG